MIRTLVMTLPLIFGTMMMMTTSGCSSASAYCEAVCQCEHCNKYTELASCRSAEKAEVQADAYNCSDKYTAAVECALEKGQCDEKAAHYTTRGNGTCTEQQLGFSCMTDADCFGGTCNASMACIERTCEVSGQACSTNADCPDEGADLCEDQTRALAECIEKASGKD